MCYSVGCKTTENEVVRTENLELKKRYELIVKFASLEDLKRVPYQLSNLKMEIMEDVSSDDNIYRVSILSKDYAIDGTLEKLNKDQGISWAKRAD
jgi:hypothetical protein